MSQVRLLVGTRKGAFVLTADGTRKDWSVAGPHFPGWEIYHLKGSPADPDRIYASVSSGWFGQVVQRSDDGGQTWSAVGNKFLYEGDRGYAPVVRRDPAPLGVQAGVAHGALCRAARIRCMQGRKMRRSSSQPMVAGPGFERPDCAGMAPAQGGSQAPGACACIRLCSTLRTATGCSLRSRLRGRSALTMAGSRGSRSTAGSARRISLTRMPRWGTACTTWRCTPRAERPFYAEALGRDADR